jgi:hypothetical protein
MFSPSTYGNKQNFYQWVSENKRYLNALMVNILGIAWRISPNENRRCLWLRFFCRPRVLLQI